MLRGPEALNAREAVRRPLKTGCSMLMLSLVDGVTLAEKRV